MSQIISLPVKRYSSGAMFFHWTMAVVVVAVAIGGLAFDVIPDSWDAAWLNLHAVGGITVLALLSGRIWWRVKHQPPPLPASTGAFNRTASHWGHIGLYLAMAAVPLIGLVVLLARGKGIDFGLFQLPALMERTPTISRPAKALHMLSAYGLMALVALHLLATLYHQYFLKDGLLQRMMPLKGSLQPTQAGVRTPSKSTKLLP